MGSEMCIRDSPSSLELPNISLEPPNLRSAGPDAGFASVGARDKQSMGDRQFEEIGAPSAKFPQIANLQWSVCLHGTQSENIPPGFSSGEAISGFFQIQFKRKAERAWLKMAKKVKTESCRRPSEPSQDALNSLFTHWLRCFEPFSTISTKIPPRGTDAGTPL